MRLLTIVLTVTLLSLAVISFATGDKSVPYRIASYYIPLLVEDSESGAFIDLLREASKRADVEYEVVMAPPRRAMRYFEDGEVVGIIPALLGTLSKDSALSRPIFTKQIHAFVRQGSDIPETIEDLEGLRVGLTRGFSYPRAITVNEKIEIDYADTTDGSLKKLTEERIDAAVVDGYTAEAAIRKLNIKGLRYDLGLVLHEQTAYIACQPTPEGRELARKLSTALDSMEADGTLDRILPDISGRGRK